jgi:putative hemolysin
LSVLAGLALIGLTFYISTLAYTVRTFSRSQLAERLPNGERDRWLTWLDEREWELQTLVSTLRVVLNLALVVTIWIWFTRDLGFESTTNTGLMVALLSFVLLAIFSIGVPHALAVHAGESLLARSRVMLMVLRGALWPCGRFYDGIEFIVRRLLGKGDRTEEEQSERVEQEILDAVSEGEAHGAFDEDQVEMIESIFELSETTVSAIMTPRTDINAISADATYDQAREVILGRGHSRIPVYEDTVDHIIGMVYAKDLLRLESPGDFDARTMMRTVPYVPESKTLAELLQEFRTTKVQIAVVLDEYGGTAGLVTIEDILEELVGEIDDEYDEQPPPEISRVDEDTLEVDGRVHVHEINEELDVEVLPEEEDYETIAGFVFATLGKIPSVGDAFDHGQIHVEIVDAEPRRIKRVRIHVLREKEKARSA